jgi:hypothetical protein
MKSVWRQKCTDLGVISWVGESKGQHALLLQVRLVDAGEGPHDDGAAPEMPGLQRYRPHVTRSSSRKNNATRHASQPPPTHPRALCWSPRRSSHPRQPPTSGPQPSDSSERQHKRRRGSAPHLVGATNSGDGVEGLRQAVVHRVDLAVVFVGGTDEQVVGDVVKMAAVPDTI